MSTKTQAKPERKSAKTRLLEAAMQIIRQNGYTATSVEDLCRAADVSKGAFFHHFSSKEELGVAAAQFWGETTGAFFQSAPYHQHADPLERVLGYIDFRKAIIDGDIAQFTCLVGTMTQEVYGSHPEIRDACADSIFNHANTLIPDIEAAMQARHLTNTNWTAQSLANHTQAVLQGAFILAKAKNDKAVALESVDHLKHYIEFLFNYPSTMEYAV
ncbi:TetR/AcrR family transcriptional regulator [Hirschia litorea]|uniref:TetR/AcrR family transcriptional regulator n=1 Tax=Hirschia litorea TaxID=1199156 RepID=A0ABW2IM68_9PROT